MTPVGYAPEGKYLWDAWFMKMNGQFHLFHLQAPRDGWPAERHDNQVSIGHAVSEDLTVWTSLPTVLQPGSHGEWDATALWTGSCFSLDSGGYGLVYTGRGEVRPLLQQIGVAVSQNLSDWQKWPGPVLAAREPFATNDDVNELGKIPAFRDPYVFRDPADRRYFMVITARLAGAIAYNGCLALAVSGDGYDWRLLPRPLLAPGIYDEMEVPQVIRHNDMWYVFFTCSDELYIPKWLGERTNGLHCYVSPSMLGPFKPANGHGGVFSSDTVRGLRLLRPPNSDGLSLALGWQEYDTDGRFVGALSRLHGVVLDGYNVAAFPL